MEVCANLAAVLDRHDDLVDRIAQLRITLSRARARGQRESVTATEGTLHTLTCQLTALLRSSEYRGLVEKARQLLPQLPELTVRFPWVDPFWGTAAQGVPQRDLCEYDNVTPLQVVNNGGLDGSSGAGERMELLSCSFNGRMCVLKGFKSSDESKLRREVVALCRLRHQNIIPLLGVCVRQEPATWFLELPLYPCNLGEWFSRQRPARDIGPLVNMLRGVLRGLQYLHQVSSGRVVFPLHTH